MSMPVIGKSENPIDREQSINNLIESVALMETGLSHIINAEGEKIQKVIKSDDPTAEVPIEDMINVNNSVERMVNTVSKLEMILQNKLDVSKDLDIVNPTPPIRSSYVEGVGTIQTVNPGETITFDDWDIVGTDITVTNNEFVINSPGLYLVEWSVNLAAGNPESLIGLMENDLPSSAITNSATVGNSSSGALIYVEDVPYNVKLINFGQTITLYNPTTAENTATSIRILKFADEPN